MKSVRNFVTDEHGSALLEFVILMPVLLVLFLSWITDLQSVQLSQFTLTSLASEVKRGIELGQQPKDIEERVNALANAVGLAGDIQVDFAPNADNTLNVQVSMGRLSASETANLEHASSLWGGFKADRGSILPMFGLFLAIMLSISISLTNSSAAIIADERAQSLASALAIQLAGVSESDFDSRASLFRVDTGQDFDWIARRNEDSTVEVRVCLPYQPPLWIAFSGTPERACAIRSARMLPSVSG
mgnify:CR=1 FL=1